MVAAIRVIAQHLAAEVGKTDDRVLRAMAKVPRHEFVPVEVKPYAYLNRPLPIGFDKTISQPLMVAVMTDLLELRPDDVVLEIGISFRASAPATLENFSPTPKNSFATQLGVQPTWRNMLLDGSISTGTRLALSSVLIMRKLE